MDEASFALEDSPLFQSLTLAEIAPLQERVHLRACKPGGCLLECGQDSLGLWVIRSGLVAVIVRDDAGLERKLASLGRGECLGEMALLTGEPCSATVRAITDTEAWFIGRSDFADLVERCPGLWCNLSRFSVCHFRTDVLSSRVVGWMFLQERKRLPTYCLAPDGPGPQALMVSNSRVALPEGRTFAQASLCQFYSALQLASKANDGKRIPEDGLCLPLRTLDPECLVAADGASVLARLLEHCDYLIVEDADLRPTDLVEHLQTFSLHTLTARDVTGALGLAGNYAYVLCPRGNEPPVSGERLW